MRKQFTNPTVRPKNIPKFFVLERLSGAKDWSELFITRRAKREWGEDMERKLLDCHLDHKDYRMGHRLPLKVKDKLGTGDVHDFQYEDFLVPLVS